MKWCTMRRMNSSTSIWASQKMRRFWSSTLVMPCHQLFDMGWWPYCWLWFIWDAAWGTVVSACCSALVYMLLCTLLFAMCMSHTPVAELLEHSLPNSMLDCHKSFNEMQSEMLVLHFFVHFDRPEALADIQPVLISHALIWQVNDQQTQEEGLYASWHLRKLQPFSKRCVIAMLLQVAFAWSQS